MNEITISIDALRQLIGEQGSQTKAEEVPPGRGHVLGRDCIIRGDHSGVFFGDVTRIDPATNTVELERAIHIWSWQGAANTAELAAHGVGKPNECKFVAAPDRIQIWDVIEVIPCSTAAAESLSSVPLWSER